MSQVIGQRQGARGTGDPAGESAWARATADDGRRFDDAIALAYRRSQAVSYVAEPGSPPRLLWTSGNLAELLSSSGTPSSGPVPAAAPADDPAHGFPGGTPRDASVIVHPDDLGPWAGAIAAAAEGHDTSLTIRLRTPDGEFVPVRDRIEVFRGDLERPPGRRLVIGSWVNVAREARAEERGRLLAGLVESAGEAIVAQVPERGVLVWNPAARRIYGFSTAEIDQGGFAALIPPDRMDELAAAVEEVRTTGEVRWLETERLRRDGSRVEVAISLSPVFQPGTRQIESIASIARDVTERNRAQREILARNHELELLHDVAGRLLSHDAPERALDDVVEAISLTTAFSLVTVQLVDPGTGELRLRAGRGATLAASMPASTLDDQTPAGVVLRTGSPLIARRSAPTSDGLATLACLPITCAGQTTGILTVATRHAREIDERLLRTLRTIASYLGLRLDRDHDEIALRDAARVSDALAQIGTGLIGSLRNPGLLGRLCEVLREALDAETAATFLLGESERSFRAVAQSGFRSDHAEIVRSVSVPFEEVRELLDGLQEAAAMEVPEVLTGLAASIRHALDDPRLMLLALRRGGQLVGVQVVGRPRDDAWRPVHLRIARSAALLASLALEDAQLYAEAVAAEKTKSDFLAAMSHELRTPLAAIIGYTDLLLEGDFGELTPMQHAPVRTTRRRAGTLLELIDETLDVSRLTAGRVALDAQPVLLDDLVADLSGDLAEELAAKPAVRMHWELPDVEVRWVTDRTKLRVVLINLIRNALRYTASGWVRFAARVEPDTIEFAVSDSGIGIEPDRIPRLFEMFVRGDTSATGERGFGLGLFIVDRLTRILSGTVSVDSTPGRGSSFRVRLPLVVPPAGVAVSSPGSPRPRWTA